MRPANVTTTAGVRVARRSASALDDCLRVTRTGVGLVLDRVHDVLNSWADDPATRLSVPADIYSCGPLKMTPEREAILDRAKEKARAQRQG